MRQRRKQHRELVRELESLRDQVQRASGARCHLPEDVLTLAILENAPFTVWACRRNFEIVLWNKRCEHRYACPAKDALGKNFFDLFAHEHERDQGKQDCISIIDDGATFVNFIADDHDANGKAMKMLTNCFRVFDDRHQEYVQAEIGVDISDLHLSEEKHRSIREMGRRLQELKMQSDLNRIAMDRQHLQIRLRDAYLEKTRVWQTKYDQLSALSRESQGHIDDSGKRLLQERLVRLNQTRVDFDNRFNAIDSRVSMANSITEVELARGELAAFVAWRVPVVPED